MKCKEILRRQKIDEEISHIAGRLSGLHRTITEGRKVYIPGYLETVRKAEARLHRLLQENLTPSQGEDVKGLLGDIEELIFLAKQREEQREAVR